MYEKCLASMLEHEKEFRTDALQQLHAMHNLNEISEIHTGAVKSAKIDTQVGFVSVCIMYVVSSFP